jgi:hypothetical protein
VSLFQSLLVLHLAPLQLVELLNFVFTTFDDALEAFGSAVYKAWSGALIDEHSMGVSGTQYRVVRTVIGGLGTHNQGVWCPL